MKVHVLGHEAVTRHFPMRDAIDTMAACLIERDRGEATAPLRQITWLPGGEGALAWMPADLRARSVLGGKLLTVYPDNARTPYESHQGVVLLFEREHGRLLAILDASTVTAIRTAAVSAVATRALAREDASSLLVVGTGTQARLHALAIPEVRPVREVRVWGRSPDRAKALADRLARDFGTGGPAVDIAPTPDLRDAVGRADIVCTVTGSREAFLAGEWLTAGTHVNAVGAAVVGFREWDATAVTRARVFVDARESARAESDEIRTALASDALDRDETLPELGEVLTGRAPGRRNPTDLTWFKSLGLAPEDLAAADFIFRKVVASPDGDRLAIDFALGRA